MGFEAGVFEIFSWDGDKYWGWESAIFGLGRQG